MKKSPVRMRCITICSILDSNAPRVAQVGTNILGHCGYEAPLWLHGTVTAGVGLTPLAATSKAHFLHHVDPRYNRALYFTWWDRLAGTYRESHPLIFSGAK